jgi:hypothetical protein
VTQESLFSGMSQPRPSRPRLRQTLDSILGPLPRVYPRTDEDVAKVQGMIFTQVQPRDGIEGIWCRDLASIVEEKTAIQHAKETYLRSRMPAALCTIGGERGVACEELDPLIVERYPQIIPNQDMKRIMRELKIDIGVVCARTRVMFASENPRLRPRDRGS